MRDSIPYTPIVELYKELKGAPQRERLHRAEEFVDDPKSLAHCFARSVQAFGRYSNTEERFYPKRRPEYTGRAGLGSTRELAALLEHGPATHQVGRGSDLAFRYVDRELVIARTTGADRYDDEHHSRATTGVRADLLLQNASDRRPVIAEVKIGTDKDPFVGLIQGLACASQLATDTQMARLHRWSDEVQWADDHLVHVYVVLAGLPKRSTYWPDLFDCAAELVDALISDRAVQKSLAGIACLEIAKIGRRAKATKLFPPRMPLGPRVQRARGSQRRLSGRSLT